MGLSEVAEKLGEYRTRLEAGQVSRIQPEHVDRVIRKLQSKRAALTESLDAAERESERVRLERKIAKAKDLIDQAHWLRDQL